MKQVLNFAAAFAVGVAATTGGAQAETTAYGTHDSTSGSYVDYM